MPRVRSVGSVALLWFLAGIAGCASGPGRPVGAPGPASGRVPLSALRTQPPRTSWQPGGYTPTQAAAQSRLAAPVAPSVADGSVNDRLARFFPAPAQPLELANVRSSRWGGNAGRNKGPALYVPTAAPQAVPKSVAAANRRGPASAVPARRVPRDEQPVSILPVALDVPAAPLQDSDERQVSREDPVSIAQNTVDEEPTSSGFPDPVELPTFIDQEVDRSESIVHETPVPPDPDLDPTLRGRPRIERLPVSSRPVGLTAPLPALSYPEDHSRSRPMDTAPHMAPTAKSRFQPPQAGLLQGLRARWNSLRRETGDVAQGR